MLKYAQVVSFPTAQFPFEKILAASVFRVPSLALLHIHWAEKTGNPVLSYADNLKLRRRMQNLADDSAFYKVYHSWVASIVAPRFGKRISYSAHPKMRVHLAGTGSVSDFHRDADVTGRPDQINCFLPFTDVFAGNTLWCESSYGSKDYQPINLKYGEALLWDGGFLEHGTFSNETSQTRVSCDFRFSVQNPDQVSEPWSNILLSRKSLGLVSGA